MTPRDDWWEKSCTSVASIPFVQRAQKIENFIQKKYWGIARSSDNPAVKLLRDLSELMQTHNSFAEKVALVGH